VKFLQSTAVRRAAGVTVLVGVACVGEEAVVEADVDGLVQAAMAELTSKSDKSFEMKDK